MRYGVDFVAPTTADVAQVMVAQGWTFWCPYVGGPRAASGRAWHINDQTQYYPIGQVSHIVKDFLPIYVGRNAPWDSSGAFNKDQGIQDGKEANNFTGACGFDSDTPLCLDVEYQTWQDIRHQRVRDYILGWVSVVNSAGHPAGIYGSIDLLNNLELGTEIDFKWGAAWTPNYHPQNAPLGRFDPASPPPWDVWQFGGAVIGGVSVDCNSATDSFKFAKYGGPV